MSDGSPRTSDDSLLAHIAEAPSLAPIAVPAAGGRLGRFTLLRRLGHGAMGVVFAARDEVLGRDVAVKVLVREATPRAHARLLAEARAAARVDHPGIARTQDAAEIDGYLVLVMELVEGSTLRELMRDRGGRLSTAHAARVIAAAAEAVHAAHVAGIVHRDLKPENVMIAPDGQVKVLDFGLAFDLDAHQPGPRSFAGTPRYAAPEAVAGQASAASDQYALAVMLLEALGARRPVMEAIDDGVPRRLRRALERALSARPEQRYPDCARLAAALTSASAPRHAGTLGAIAAICLVAATTSFIHHDHDDSVLHDTTAAAGPRPPREVACPPLRSEEGWLGAAAASLACRRARAHFGGAAARATPPAALLGLPALPGPAFPRDPFAEPGAREKAVRAAEATDRVILDGEVHETDEGFSVALSAIWRDEVLARGAGRGDLAGATSEAVAAILSTPRLPQSDTPDLEAITWLGATTHEQLERLDSAQASLATSADLARALERLDAETSPSPVERLIAARLAAGLGAARRLTPPAADTSSGPSLARTAPYRVLLGGTGGAELAAATEAARLQERSAAGRFHLLAAEATIRLALGEGDRARILALAAARERPVDAPWSVLAAAAYGRPEMASVARAYAAWRPETADAWNIVAHVDAGEGEHLGLLERAHRLSDAFPLYAGNLGTALLLAGREDEAAAVAARLEVGSLGQRVAAARLRTEIVLADGRFRAAYDTAWRGLERLETIGSIESGDVALVGLFVELGVLLGEGPETARRIVSTFVASDPPRLDQGPLARACVAHACAYAAPAVARRCFARLDELDQAGFFPLGTLADTDAYVEGARAFSQEDVEGAAAAFRRVKSELGVRASVAALAFERAGDGEQADRVDPPRPGIAFGVSSSYARNARRAAARGDCERASALARRLLEGWRAADTRLAVLDEMEALLSRCARGPKIR